MDTLLNLYGKAPVMIGMMWCDIMWSVLTWCDVVWYYWEHTLVIPFHPFLSFFVSIFLSCSPLSIRLISILDSPILSFFLSIFLCFFLYFFLSCYFLISCIIIHSWTHTHQKKNTSFFREFLFFHVFFSFVTVLLSCAILLLSMQTALKTFAVDDTSVSGFLYHR